MLCPGLCVKLGRPEPRLGKARWLCGDSKESRGRGDQGIGMGTGERETRETKKVKSGIAGILGGRGERRKRWGGEMRKEARFDDMMMEGPHSSCRPPFFFLTPYDDEMMK